MKSKFVLLVSAILIMLSTGNASASVMVETIEFLTDAPELEFSPIWTKDDSQIMYVFQNSIWNNRQSYIMNADGTGQIRNFIGEDMLVELFDLSPDGSELLIVKNFGFWFDVYKVNVNNGELVPIAADSSILEYGGYWSPDGKKIAYNQGDELSHELWLMDSEGNNKHRLGTSSHVWGIDWTSDGSKIIYSDNFDLWMIDSDGNNQFQITNTQYKEWHPRLSPDGKYIVYASNEGGTPDLWLRNIAGSYKLRLTNDIGIHDANPKWSHDGTRIAFVGHNWGGDRDYADIAVITLSFDNEGPISSNLLVSPNPVEMNENIILNALVDDTTTGSSDIVSAEYSLDGGINWNLMMAQDGSFDSPTEGVAATFTISDSNVYNLCVRGTDSASNTGLEKCISLVVYDPNSMVAGGGWYYPLDDDEISMPGTATFGFITKIRDSSATGNLEFQYHVEDKFNLKSTSITWLVVSNSNAQFKGTATLNGEPGYYFRVMGKDNGEPGDLDWFSIKIWNGDPDTEDSTLIHSSHNTLAGGNIKVKTK